MKIGTKGEKGLFNIKIVNSSILPGGRYGYEFILEDGRKGVALSSSIQFMEDNCYVVELKILGPYPKNKLPEEAATLVEILYWKKVLGKKEI